MVNIGIFLGDGIFPRKISTNNACIHALGLDVAGRFCVSGAGDGRITVWSLGPEAQCRVGLTKPGAVEVLESSTMDHAQADIRYH